MLDDSLYSGIRNLIFIYDCQMPYSAINLKDIALHNLKWANCIPKEDLHVYAQLKRQGQPISSVLLLELEKVDQLLAQLHVDLAEDDKRKKTQSYFEMLHAIYSGIRPRNFSEEIGRATVWKEALIRFKFLYPWDKETEWRFENAPLIDRLAQDLNQIRSLIGERNTLVDYKINQSEILMEDIELCLCWSGRHPTDSRANLDDLITRVGLSEASRLLSARVAEKASERYYKELGLSVEDISIQQLQANGSDEWKNFDLLVGDVPVDVKNARASFSNPDSYVEHYIPRFKLSRGSSTEVSIVGVLSPSKKDHKLFECKILGETSLTYARKLWKWMTASFGSVIRVDGLWKNNHFPSWIFEYPTQHYTNLTSCNQQINLLVSQVLALNRTDIEIPPWIFALADKTISKTDLLSDPQKEIISDLHALRDALGYTRPSLYLYILGRAMVGIVEQRPLNVVFEPLLPIIFIPVSNTEETAPLGLEDPSSSIKSLVKNLIVIYNKVIESKLRFIAFKLTHPQILSGQLESGSWITVLAYCGGHVDYKNYHMKCGNIPLVLGIHENCQICGHLICDNCNYCSADCPREV